jgi:phosphoglycerate dehydrogenase-like enzyme
LVLFSMQNRTFGPYLAAIIRIPLGQNAHAPALAQEIKEFAAGGVKLIAMRCAGFDRVDLDAAKEVGINVVNVPRYAPASIAEHAVALALCLNRCGCGRRGFLGPNDLRRLMNV